MDHVTILLEERTMSTRVAELTVDELRQVIQEAMEQKLAEMHGDPDEGLGLREEIKDRLQRFLEAERRGARGIPAQEVAAQLGLEWWWGGNRITEALRGMRTLIQCVQCPSVASVVPTVPSGGGERGCVG
jgi:hypothetical protein